MKKIIIKLAIILGLLFIIDRAATFIFTKFIFSKTLSGESGGNITYLIQKKKDIGFLILGSSRAKHHINPALLTNLYAGNGYNAGINGTGGLIYNSMLLDLLVSKRCIPKLIILQIDAHPYFTVNDINVSAELSQLYPFLSESEILKKEIEKNCAYSERIKLFLHSYRFNGKLLNILYNYQKRNSVINNNGFEGLPGTIDTTGFSTINDLPKKYIYSKIKIDALTNIAQTCKANHIKLIVVFPPSYKNNIFFAEGNNAIINVLHSNEVSDIYDFSNVEKSPSLQSKDMWRDATHLNNEGAMIFSRMLNDSLIHIR